MATKPLPINLNTEEREWLERLAQFYGRGNKTATVRWLIKEKATDLGFCSPDYTLQNKDARSYE